MTNILPFHPRIRVLDHYDVAYAPDLAGEVVDLDNFRPIRRRTPDDLLREAREEDRHNGQREFMRSQFALLRPDGGSAF